MVEQIRARTREFLVRHISSAELDNSLDIFAAGFVNSLFALQLVLFLERSFGIAVQDEDLEIANFRSVDAITAFVVAKTPGAEAGKGNEAAGTSVARLCCG